jgi:hypothetical protein
LIIVPVGAWPFFFATALGTIVLMALARVIGKPEFAGYSLLSFVALGLFAITTDDKATIDRLGPDPVRTQAKITHRSGCDDDGCTQITFEYSVDGVRYQHSTDGPDAQTVNVLYDPRKPDRYAFPGQDEPVFYGLTFLAVVVLAVGGPIEKLHDVWTRRRQRAIDSRRQPIPNYRVGKGDGGEYF